MISNLLSDLGKSKLATAPESLSTLPQELGSSTSSCVEMGTWNVLSST